MSRRLSWSELIERFYFETSWIVWSWYNLCSIAFELTWMFIKFIMLYYCPDIPPENVGAVRVEIEVLCQDGDEAWRSDVGGLPHHHCYHCTKHNKNLGRNNIFISNIVRLSKAIYILFLIIINQFMFYKFLSFIFWSFAKK